MHCVVMDTKCFCLADDLNWSLFFVVGLILWAFWNIVVGLVFQLGLIFRAVGFIPWSSPGLVGRVFHACLQLLPLGHRGSLILLASGQEKQSREAAFRKTAWNIAHHSDVRHWLKRSPQRVVMGTSIYSIPWEQSGPSAGAESEIHHGARPGGFMWFWGVSSRRLSRLCVPISMWWARLACMAFARVWAAEIQWPPGSAASSLLEVWGLCIGSIWGKVQLTDFLYLYDPW